MSYTRKEYAEMAARANKEGKLLEIVDGKPVLVDPPAPPPPTPVEIQKQLTDAVQSYMDSKVRERGYDNIHTACSYAVSTSEKFKAEGGACVVWRDAVWLTCYAILDEVLAGERDIPTVEELLNELPVLEW